MPAGTSLGSGIALQSGNRNDYWMRKLADDWAARRAAAAKAEQEKKKQAADNQKWFLGMLTVPEGMAPVMMDGASRLIDQAYTNAEGAFESGDLTTLHKIITDTKIGVNQIKRANDDMGKWINDPNTIAPPGLRVAWNQNGTKWEDLSKYANYLAKFPIFGENYSISVPETLPPYKMEQLKVDDYEFLNVDKSGKLVYPEERLSGTLTNVYKKRGFVSQKQKQAKFEELLKDNNYMQRAISTIIASKPDDEILKYDLNRAKNETPQQFLERNQDLKDQLEAVTWDFINMNSQEDTYEPVTGSIPKPSKGKTDKKSKVVLVKHDTEQVVPNKIIGANWFTAEEKAQMGIPEWGEVGKPIYFKYDEEINISKVSPTYIAVTEEMKKLNPELEGFSAISVAPGTMYRNTNNGKWYVTGKVDNYYTDQSELLMPNERNIKSSTMQVFIPYENMESSIKGYYTDIEDYMYGGGGGVPSQPGSNKGNAPSGGTVR